MSKPKLVITGASGFLGYHLVREAAERYDVYALYNSERGDFESVNWLQCDITNHIQVGDLLEDIEPDFIIHAAASADTNFCELHPKESRLVNVDATINLVGIAADFNIPFVFTSTDLVFDGERGLYTEEDAPNPVNEYGRQKAEAERVVLEIYPNTLVARLPLMYGDVKAGGNGNYLRRFIADNNEGKVSSLFHDEYRSIGGAYSIANGIVSLMPNQHGIVQIAGKEVVSRYEFGLMAADVFALNKTLLQSVSQIDFIFVAKRPKNVSLDITKALHLGYTPLSIIEELKLI
jgi:dTDP-4-dehydrorhamnose reductase